ncbi:MAG: DoxX family protein, partial [Pseudomonadota bacterium]
MLNTLKAPEPDDATRAHLALTLRIGLGTVFVIGGIAKLRRLLDPALAEGIVSQYMGSLGYINDTFQQLLFSGALPGFVTPWSFLTLLSAFELVAGAMLVAGLLVRPLALFWSVFIWSFIFSLPVVTTPGVVPEETTYSSPALFVQVRDVALSGLFVALYLLGAGSRSVDAGVYGLPRTVGHGWDGPAALMRYSLAVMFLVGGVFHGFHKIPTFDTPALVLVVVGLGLAAGVGPRIFAAGAVAVMVWYMAGKLG